MGSIDLKTYKNMLDTLKKVDDNNNLFCGFRENQDTYFHTVSEYCEDYMQEYDVSEIYELREILQNFWDDSSPYKAMIPSVLYLCNKLKTEDKQRFTGIDLVNYMM